MIPEQISPKKKKRKEKKRKRKRKRIRPELCSLYGGLETGMLEMSAGAVKEKENHSS